MLCKIIKSHSCLRQAAMKFYLSIYISIQKGKIEPDGQTILLHIYEYALYLIL